MAKRRPSKSTASIPAGDAFYACNIKPLPDELAEKAAKYAVKENPGNAPAVGLQTALAMLSDGTTTPQRIAILVGKYWGNQGVDLTVSFLSQASAALKDKILLYMNKINEYANVKFSLATGSNYGDIRISMGAGGYWSYLGTDVRQIPKNQPTMNLQGFSLSTSDAEYNRVVTHETLHSLGCPHEHMRAAIIERLDYEKTIAYFRATQGWTRQDVIAQVLTPVEEESIMGSPTADEDSVMAYSLPGSITRDGKPIKGGAGITANDGRYMGQWYPKKVNPPVDPADPSTPLPPDPVVIQIWGARKIVIPGYVVKKASGASSEFEG